MLTRIVSSFSNFSPVFFRPLIVHLTAQDPWPDGGVHWGVNLYSPRGTRMGTSLPFMTSVALLAVQSDQLAVTSSPPLTDSGGAANDSTAVPTGALSRLATVCGTRIRVGTTISSFLSSGSPGTTSTLTFCLPSPRSCL